MKTVRLIAFVFTYLFAVSLLTACSSVTQPIADDSAELESQPDVTKGNSNTWSGAQHYRYHYQNTCFCPSEYTREMFVTVKNGVISEAHYLDNKEQVSSGGLADVQTVEMLFKLIEQAEQENWHRAEIKFHPTLGYPEQSVFNVLEGTSDGLQQYSISNLIILPDS